MQNLEAIEAMPVKNHTISVIPSGFAAGAEIRGADLSQPLDEQSLRLIEETFNEHGVVYFRGQSLSPEQHLAFTRYFGDIEQNMHLQYAHTDFPDVQVVSNIVDDEGNFIGLPDAGRSWHSDMSYTVKPPRCSILHSLEVPLKDGKPLGDTLFTNVAAAYDALPENMKKKLNGLKAKHSYGAKHALRKKTGLSSRDFTKEQEETPTVIHPVVRTHPFTGRKCLYVIEGECFGIIDMPDVEALPLLEELFQHSIKAEFQFHHTWQVGDVLMWDNCTVQHMAVHDYALPQRRLMHRTTASGSKPI